MGGGWVGDGWGMGGGWVGDGWGMGGGWVVSVGDGWGMGGDGWGMGGGWVGDGWGMGGGWVGDGWGVGGGCVSALQDSQKKLFGVQKGTAELWEGTKTTETHAANKTFAHVLCLQLTHVFLVTSSTQKTCPSVVYVCGAIGSSFCSAFVPKKNWLVCGLSRVHFPVHIV